MNVSCLPATDIKGINIVCKEKIPLSEVSRAMTVEEKKEGGKAGNYKKRCSLTDYYIKAGGGSNPVTGWFPPKPVTRT